MILGIISIVTGAIIFIAGLTKDITTVQQQTVQYLGFIWASLFFIGGAIMITIEKSVKPKPKNETEAVIADEAREQKYKSWACPKCGEQNPNDTYKCGKCGYSLT